MLIKIENGVPVGEPPIDERNFRQLHSNTSFPRILTPEDVESFGYGLFQQTSQPEPAKFMKCVEDTPVKNESGFYVQTWKRTAMSSDEIDEITKAKEKEIKSIRDDKLKESDWIMVVSASRELDIDSKSVNQWKNYRKRLRSISAQKGYPWDVIWPEKPPLNINSGLF